MICVVDQELTHSLHMNGCNGQNISSSMPWETITYVTKPMLDQSLSLDSEVGHCDLFCDHFLTRGIKNLK